VASQVGPPRQGRRCASGRAGGAVRCVGEERRGASEKSGASGTGAATRGGGDDDRGIEAIWGKTAKCRSGRRRGLYRIPNLLSQVVLPTMTKGPLVSRRIASRPVTKGAFRAGCPEGEFSPFSPGWCYHP
jgi:hypothetical protein